MPTAVVVDGRWERLVSKVPFGRLLCVLAAACLSVALVACESYEPQSSEEGALAYYQAKYHEEAQLADSHGLGNYNLFGYSYRGMEYLMTDGTSVIYLDDEGIFKDNRQSGEIQAAACAFAQGKLDAIPASVIAPGGITVGEAVGYETYEGEGVCWHDRYEGNIEVFLMRERPPLYCESSYSGEGYAEGRFSYVAAYDYQRAGDVEAAWLLMGRFFDLSSIGLAIVDPASFVAGETSLFDDALRYTVSFGYEPGRGVYAVRFKPKFVPLMKGVVISSGVPGVTLEEGDVSFVRQEDGFWRCRITGAAAEADGKMSYYLHNDSGMSILRVNGIDSFSKVCGAYEHLGSCMLVDGALYYLGDPDDITPWVEVESIDRNRVVFRYHTHFRDQIGKVQLRVIGFAMKEGSSSWETVGFESRILEPTEDGWRCEVEVREDARSENTFCFQFTYDDDEDVTVQIEQDIQLPL